MNRRMRRDNCVEPNQSMKGEGHNDEEGDAQFVTCKLGVVESGKSYRLVIYISS